jgi:hypothetical protein
MSNPNEYVNNLVFEVFKVFGNNNNNNNDNNNVGSPTISRRTPTSGGCTFTCVDDNNNHVNLEYEIYLYGDNMILRSMLNYVEESMKEHINNDGFISISDANDVINEFMTRYPQQTYRTDYIHPMVSVKFE